MHGRLHAAVAEPEVRGLDSGPAELSRSFERQAVRDVGEGVEVQMSNVGVVAPLRLAQQGQHAVRGDGNQRRSDDNTTSLRRAGTAVDGPDVDANFTSGGCEEVVGDAFERVVADEARQYEWFCRVRKV